MGLTLPLLGSTDTHCPLNWVPVHNRAKGLGETSVSRYGLSLHSLDDYGKLGLYVPHLSNLKMEPSYSAPSQ